MKINDGNSGNNLIYFPCLKFIKERLDLFEEYGIGAFVWEGGNGMKYFYELFWFRFSFRLENSFMSFMKL